MYRELILNAALLVALSSTYGLIERWRTLSSFSRSFLKGALFGGTAVIGMTVSLEWAPGVFYDGRSVILPLAGLFGGTWPAVLAAALSGGYRLLLGGPGLWAGLATIGLTTALGIIFRRRYRTPSPALVPLHLYVLGVVSQVLMLIAQLLLPWPYAFEVLGSIWLPILAVFPAATMLLGLILEAEQRHSEAQEALRAAYERLTTAQEIARLGFLEWDFKDGAIRLSAQLIRLLDPSEGIPDRMLLTDFQNLVHPQDWDIAFSSLFREAVGTPTESPIFRLLRPDGGTLWVRAHATVREDKAGKPSRKLVALVDVTDRVEIEEALRQSERHLALRNRVAEIFLQESGEEALFKTLALVLEETRSRQAILACAEPPDEWTCLVLTRGLEEDFRRLPSVKVALDRCDRLWVEAVSCRIVVGSEGPFRPAESLPAMQRALIAPVIFQDAVIGLVIVGDKDGDYGETDQEIVRQIADRLAPTLDAQLDANRREAERRSLEAQLRQTQKMEVFGRLAGGIAHDFNNLLSIILGWGEILRQHLPDTGLAREAMTNILQAAERAAALTRQLLIFSRKQAVQMQVVEINELVRNFSKMLRRLLDENIDLEVVTSPERLTVEIDPLQLEQVLLNLAVNARDAMPEGGVLRIETAFLPAKEVPKVHRESMGQSEEYVCVSVSDTGCGMDNAVLEQIFEPFFTTKGEGKGTGLGLSVVYGIVKQFGGEIRVQSQLGKGSRFDILFPKVEGEQPGISEALSDKLPSGQNRLVLLVEDDPGLRLVARQMLERVGYRVMLAATGRQAIELVEREALSPDLLISDVVMPGMSGPSLVEALRRRDPKLKVLYISGYPDLENERARSRLENDPLLRKPFAWSDLLRTVSDILSEATAEETSGDRSRTPPAVSP
ncbi:MAG TPA: ATP-binding protein [Acidobacteriota bacterium]|jgi:signal transduction histidine kinase/ActR/RegA family two-component response regulator/PAS domain-containing protein|nr:ATP-binding protein [Acidobacteriota bacterium]HRR25411.1 ATP-binding protein [Acidobacteriota bacterium]HRV06853.1 ATP-binding protein [Acidobacteriota bacterium]